MQNWRNQLCGNTKEWPYKAPYFPIEYLIPFFSRINQIFSPPQFRCSVLLLSCSALFPMALLRFRSPNDKVNTFLLRHMGDLRYSISPTCSACTLLANVKCLSWKLSLSILYYCCVALAYFKSTDYKIRGTLQEHCFSFILNQSPYFSPKDVARVAFMTVLVNKLLLSNAVAGTTFTRFHYIFQQ